MGMYANQMTVNLIYSLKQKLKAKKKKSSSVKKAKK